MTTSSFEQARFNMVEQQIRPWEVLDQRVLSLMESMPRDAFVPEKYQGLAYADIEIPISGDQHMMFPRVEGRLLQALNIQPADKVLEIGTGSGYLTACMAKLAGSVISLDTNAEFTQQAQARLDDQNIKNVELRNSDGLAEGLEGAPFDAIAVTGSMPTLTEALKQQLSVGGRLFVVTGEAPAMEANLITRVSDDAWRTEGLFETELDPLIGAPAIEAFQF